MFKTSKNHNSVKIVLDFTGVLRLLGNNSVIPLLTAAKKRHFYPPKLPALQAEVDGLAQKSARPFSCFLAAFSPRRPKSLDFDHFQRFPAFAASGRSRPFRRISFFDRTRCAGLRSNFPFSRTAAQRPVLSFWWARARLCPENRTQPRHAAHAGGQAFFCCACWNASNRFRMRSCSHSASSFASFCS